MSAPNLGSKTAPKGVPKLDQFWNPLAPPLSGLGIAISYSYWNVYRAVGQCFLGDAGVKLYADDELAVMKNWHIVIVLQ